MKRTPIKHAASKKRTRKGDGLNTREINHKLTARLKSLDAKQGLPTRIRMRMVFGEGTD